MKEFIKYFEDKLELYCYRVHWAMYTQDVRYTCEIVTDHLSTFITVTFGGIGLLLSPFVVRINFDKLGFIDLELFTLISIFIVFVISYIFIIRPLNNYIDELFTQESVDRIGAVNPYTKLQINLFRIYMLFFYFIPGAILVIMMILIPNYYWTLPCFQ